MRYRVYSGPSGTRSISPLEKDKLLFKEFGALDDAFAWAQHVGTTGRVALLIEGDDGTHLTKHEIAGALRHRDRQEAFAQ
ncbi:MAG: hypothetical protein GEU91_22990 [Rhizobiales bacterium]|nr:hypothetical protein [Hyphomicrobiales bacterium]